MRKLVYFNHDGGVDDLVSLFLLLQMDDIELIGTSVIPGDCYLEPALSASRKIIDRFGSYRVETAASDSRGVNPFPKEWRMHAFYVDALPILNEKGTVETPVSALPAHLHLIESLKNSKEPVTLLFTGPLTDLARALEKDPSIEKRIEKLVWMGGTFLEKGNVEEPEHDGTAEWNAFWDPYSVKTVFASGIAIEMVALESTNQVPLTNDIRSHWASLRKHIGIDFIGQCYALCPPLVHTETNSTYYLWDVLTTLTLGRKDMIGSKTVNAIVHTESPRQGTTEAHPDGRPVEVVDQVDREAFFSYFEELMKKADYIPAI
ncbi:nucleoside hydrolase [Bacillus glycinifermentans]|uniref:nucleoside hydrolase n=1 Tax=Bacillus glycinifermentans TaxID=1664069 RepID=UPI002DBD9725|nr:nucleoside hydrolase [Bacillus glycinifermentans]MEC3608653.1 nucleoside hydrolase [Bacillus glycinifermentans]